MSSPDAAPGDGRQGDDRPVVDRQGDDEETALGRLAARLPRPPHGEVWIGDDAAVLGGDPGPLLLAADLVAEGVHFDRRFSSLADVGWKVMVANVSDIAAMGGRPLRCVVTVAGDLGADLDALYDGVVAAARHYGCPVVGGDLSAPATGGGLCCSVSVLGTADGRAPVLRSGARPGDTLYVTGPLGAAAAGLRALQAHEAADSAAVRAHRRPEARLVAGQVAARAGARAMIDVSDGLGLDLDRLARASMVGIALDEVPVAHGARRDDALGGGEDYELIIATDAPEELCAAFAASGLPAPRRIGCCVADVARRSLAGGPLPIAGWRHGVAQDGEPTR